MNTPQNVNTPQNAAKGSPRQIDRDRELTSGLASSWSYEETVRQVEVIMRRIESGELELADVFDQFATALGYLRQCEEFLSQRQQQIDLLIETFTEASE